MKTAVVLLAVVAAWLVAGVLTEAFLPGAPVILGSRVSGLLCVAVIAALILFSLRRLSVRNIPFLLAHLGVAVILAGAAGDSLLGRMGSLWLGIGRETADELVMTCEAGSGEPVVIDPYFNPRFAVPLGFEVILLSYPSLSYPVEGDGPVLRFHGGREGDITRTLEINRPVSYGGWRFFFTSYAPGGGTISVLATRSPCRPVVFTGIWMLIAGVCALCFIPLRRSIGAGGGGEG